MITTVLMSIFLDFLDASRSICPDFWTFAPSRVPSERQRTPCERLSERLKPLRILGVNGVNAVSARPRMRPRTHARTPARAPAHTHARRRSPRSHACIPYVTWATRVHSGVHSRVHWRSLDFQKRKMMGTAEKTRLAGIPSQSFADGQITLYHGDCLDILPLLPEDDAVITDPPYSSGGIEQSAEYFDVSCRRIERLLAGLGTPEDLESTVANIADMFAE